MPETMTSHQAWERMPKVFAMPEEKDGFIQPGAVMDSPGLIVLNVSRVDPAPAYRLGLQDEMTMLKPFFTTNRSLLICVARAKNKGRKNITNVAMVAFDVMSRIVFQRGLTPKGAEVAEAVARRMQPLVNASSIVPF